MSEGAGHGSRGVRLFREGGLYTLGMFVLRAGNFLLLPLYTALLTAEDYGAYSIVFRIVGVLVPLAVLGQTHSVLRLSVDAADRTRLFQTAVAFVALWSVVVMGGAAVAWPWLDAWIGLPLWPVGLAGLLSVTAQALFNLNLTWLQSQHRAGDHTRLSVLRWVVLLVGVAAFVVGLKLGAAGILLAVALSYGVVAVYALRASLGAHRPALHQPELRQALAYGLPFVPHTLASVVLVATDQVLLAAHDAHGLGVAGLYALGANLASAVFMLAVGMQTAWAPHFLEADRDHETRGWGEVRRLSFFIVAVVACGAVGMGLFAPEAVWIAGAFSGSDWSAAAGVVPILAMAALARTYYTVALTVLTANKAFARYVVLVSVPAALLNGWLNTLWIPDYGMRGAAWATTCSWLITAVYAAVVARFARPVPFKYARAVVLMALVVGTLQLGEGASLPARVGLGVGFVALLLVLDYRDLRRSGTAFLARRFR